MFKHFLNLKKNLSFNSTYSWCLKLHLFSVSAHYPIISYMYSNLLAYGSATFWTEGPNSFGGVATGGPNCLTERPLVKLFCGLLTLEFLTLERTLELLKS